MRFLHNCKLWLSPLRMTDPDFGNLVFIHSSKFPERSSCLRRYTAIPNLRKQPSTTCKDL
jgi:hypothetical protein